MICEVAMAQNGITSSKSTCVGVWGASRLDGERGSTSRKLESAICCAMPFPVLPDPIGDREREQDRRHPEREILELAAAGAAKVLGADRRATRALAKAAFTMSTADLWQARLAVKTLRLDQREAIAEAAES